jgi:DNA-binding transcriptional regulator YiaG
LIISSDDYLAHYGILRKSGRYPWGSGETQSQRNRDFLSTVEDLRKNHGMSETEIANSFGLTTSQLRTSKTIAKAEEKQAQIGFAQRLKDKGMSNGAIAERMGLPNESSVRALLEPGRKDRLDILNTTSNMLKGQVEEKKYLDIGAGVEYHIGVSGTKLKAAIAKLQEEGYKVQYLKVQQLGTGKNTTLKVLTKDDVTYSELFKNRDQVKQITDISEDGGRSFSRIKPPESISSRRVAVRYAEQGGADADGVLYVRRGVDDVSLGASNYAQVRVAVDGTHYLKGMAMYSDNLPAGVDILFNTNKSDTGVKTDAMKKLKTDDPDNPFGAVIKRQHGKINIVNEEGDWDDWSRNLSSQFLSKQKPALARQQLAMAFERRQNELETISKLTNPAVKRKLLESFADDADSAAVHLKAAALPRQSTHVILPVNSLKETEIYAPNFRNGERVALVRYPHGGIFEIPELTVNNNHPQAKKSMGGAKDAVGIHSKVAARLSGADFDGDTVLVIPNNRGHVKTAPALEGLKGFDPQRAYPAYEGMPRMSPRTKQVQMGVVSNLITDMTIRGATDDELARAVRHSMVVIDAEKHNLNYKQSAKDNGIAQLKEKYQGGKNSGAATLISRAGSDVRVAERKQGYRIDPATGRKIYSETGASYTNADGKTIVRTTKSSKLAEASDAHSLSSGTVVEKHYADYSNSLKSLANQARKEAAHTANLPYSPSAKAAYAKQVASLDSKLALALRNAPLERQAQVIANAGFAARKQANPDLEPSDLKKIRAQELEKARARTGARKNRIEITDDEWAAIQAGAISNHKLNQILANADLDKVKQMATPRSAVSMTPVKIGRARAMLAAGYTQAEVADALGVSVSTLKSAVDE